MTMTARIPILATGVAAVFIAVAQFATAQTTQPTPTIHNQSMASSVQDSWTQLTAAAQDGVQDAFNQAIKNLEDAHATAQQQVIAAKKAADDHYAKNSAAIDKQGTGTPTAEEARVIDAQKKLSDAAAQAKKDADKIDGFVKMVKAKEFWEWKKIVRSRKTMGVILATWSGVVSKPSWMQGTATGTGTGAGSGGGTGSGAGTGTGTGTGTSSTFHPQLNNPATGTGFYYVPGQPLGSAPTPENPQQMQGTATGAGKGGGGKTSSMMKGATTSNTMIGTPAVLGSGATTGKGKTVTKTKVGSASGKSGTTINTTVGKPIITMPGLGGGF